jgi:hypothetical protein
MTWVIDESMMKELEEALAQGGREQVLKNLAANCRRWRGASTPLLLEAESDLSDIVQAAEKGDCRALAQAINEAKVLLMRRGWQVCEDCGEVWWPPDHGRSRIDECPNCVEEWSVIFDEFNPETMEKDDLMALWRLTDGARPVAAARKFFGEPPYRRGYVKVFKNLGAYACNKAVAVGLRSEGQIMSAQEYEQICEGIYRNLPAWAKW